MGDFLMPSLGADMESGIVTEWKVRPGDEVHRGDIVAEVETSKADIDIEVFEDGVVQELLAQEGERVAVGTPIARIAPAEAGVATAPAEMERPAVAVQVEAPAPSPPAAAATPPPLTPPPVHHLRVSPVARRAAEALHVDLSSVRGTGPGGAISRRDVERAAGAEAAPRPAEAAPRPAAPAPRPVEPARDGDRADAMRAAIAALMARSKREIPHYYLEHDIDMTAAMDWLRERNAARPVAERLIPGVLLLKAAAMAAREVPQLNGFWVDGAFQPAEHVHLGVAVSLRAGGLVAPAIHDADTKPLEELMGDLRDLVRRARVGRMRQGEMSDPTLTVTSLGDQGVDVVHGVIYPPQVALAGFGRVSERPWAHDGMVGGRQVVRATLAGDHRASDGYSGARFLRTVERLLQHPEEL